MRNASKVVTPSKAGHAPPPARDHGTTAAVRSMHHAMQPYYAVGNDAADGNAGAACQPAWRDKCVRDRVRERVPPQERTGREPMTSARDTSRPEPLHRGGGTDDCCGDSESEVAAASAAVRAWQWSRRMWLPVWRAADGSPNRRWRPAAPVFTI